jgi:hypothetical protein
MEKQVKINNVRSLSKIIDAIVKEGVKSSLYRNSVEEKNKQLSLSEEDDDLLDDSGDDSEQKAPSKTADSDQEKLKKGDVTAEDVIGRLNSIRSGKSFKDESIGKKMEEYVESLTKPERVALLAFLKGISQIVTGEVDPDAAADPESHPANIKMEKSDEKKTKTIKPNVIKAPEKPKTSKKPAAEDTSGPVPITPKKK